MARRSKLMRFGMPVLAGVIVLVIALVRFGGNGTAGDDPRPEPDNGYLVEKVTIESVEVRLAESYPVQVFVEVAGYMPDPCWEAQPPTVEQDGSRWNIEIVAEREADLICAQVIEPYEEVIALGPVDPGDYLVDVNGVEQTFTVH